MNQTANQILTAVRGRPEDIQRLAKAIINNDADDIWAYLTSRGIQIEHAELTEIISQARAGNHQAANGTFTGTFTYT